MRAQLASGEIPQGTRLLTVREAADVLGVHFNTVARAYRELEREGLISTRPGRGSYVWRTQQFDGETSRKSLEGITKEFIVNFRENGYTKMEVLRELRKQMIPGVNK